VPTLVVERLAPPTGVREAREREEHVGGRRHVRPAVAVR
jgi:hypothetical protein